MKGVPGEQPFRDRAEAGRLLASELEHLASRPDLLVLALPRGGVPVARVVADALSAPLDVIVVRKLGVPGQEELAMGAVGPGETLVVDRGLVRQLGIGDEVIERVAAAERREIDRRERRYRGDRPPPPLADKTVLLVDDGLATGATMQGAIAMTRQERAREVIVAVPVAAPETCERLRALADEVICLRTPAPFRAVGLWYEDFRPVGDEEVQALLQAQGRTPT